MITDPIKPPSDVGCCTCGKMGKHYSDECPDRFCRYCGDDHTEFNDGPDFPCDEFPPKGYFHSRTETSPHERAVAEFWEQQMRQSPDTVSAIIGQHATIEQEKMAYTMMQWLGTNVGSNWMRRVQKIMDELPECKRRCSNKRMPEDKYCALCKYHIDAGLIKVPA